MGEALEITFQVLGKTPNEAADEVLMNALNSKSEEVRLHATHAIFERRYKPGLSELLNRLHDLDPKQKEVMNEHRLQIQCDGHRIGIQFTFGVPMYRK